MLNKYELPLLKEEAERVDTLRYAWEKVLSQGGEVQSHLVDIQPTFKKTLLVNVCTFKTEVENFAKDYDLNGPMVNGKFLWLLDCLEFLEWPIKFYRVGQNFRLTLPGSCSCIY